MIIRSVIIALVLAMLAGLALTITLFRSWRSLGLETDRFETMSRPMRFSLPATAEVIDSTLVLPDGFAVDLAVDIERELSRVPGVTPKWIEHYCATVRERFRGEFNVPLEGVTYEYVTLPMVVENWIRIDGFVLQRNQTHADGPAAEANEAAFRATRVAIEEWIGR